MKAPNVDHGWAWLVLASSFLIHIMTYGMSWSTGVYNVIFLDAFRQPKGVTAWAGALPTAVMYGIGPISSMLTNKYGFRPVVIGGGLLSGLGLSLSYFAPNLYYLYFTFGVMAGAGYGIAYIPAISAISCYFDKRLSIAAGIAASGTGVGNFLYPAVIRYLINMFGWQESLLIIGAATFNICVCGLVLRPVKRSEIPENNPILDITPFKKKGYLMLCVNNFLFCCGISALYIHLTAHAERKGIDPDRSASLISGLGIANLIGRFSYGLISYLPYFNCFVLYSVSFALSGVFICIVPFFDSYEGLMFCAVMFGLLSGCFGTLLVTILIELLGLQRFANGYGCLLLFEAAGQLIGGSLAGAMFDATKSYTVAFIIGGVLAVLSSFVMIQPYLYVKNHPQSLEMEVAEEKAAMASATDVNSVKYGSHRDFIQMTISMESLAAVNKIENMHNKIVKRLNGKLMNGEIDLNYFKSTDSLPVNKPLLSLKSQFPFSSTETV